MPRGGGGVRRSELAVAAAAATGSLLYCMCSARSGDMCSARSGDGMVPPPRQTAKAWSTRAAVPTGLPAPTFGGGIFESLDDDMVLLVLRHLSRIDRGADTLNAAADAAAAALMIVERTRTTVHEDVTTDHGDKGGGEEQPHARLELRVDH